MKKTVKEFYDYWNGKRLNFVFDSEILDVCVTHLLPHELKIVELGWEECVESEALNVQFTFLMNKIFNRHNDIASRYTRVENDELVITPRSSITELDISMSTYKNCNASCIYHIEDVQKDILPSLTFESIAELTGAILTFQKEHEDAGSN